MADSSTLDQFKTGGFVAGYPLNIKSFYSPVDDVHGAILEAIKGAKHSLVVAMYGYDDPDIQSAIEEKMKEENIFVQLTLDSSQAGGKAEKALLTSSTFPATSIAIGRSEKSAIMHLKCLVIDSAVLITGSTNWSTGGEEKQDNACIIISDAYVAGEAVSRISAIHQNMLAKANKKKEVSNGKTNS